MVKVLTFVFLFALSACSSTSDEAQSDMADVGTNEMGSTPDAESDFDPSICEGLDERSCQHAEGCESMRGRPYNSEESCYEETTFALCTGTPQCNNGLFFLHIDPSGTCWEFNSCTPVEWTYAMNSECESSMTLCE